jgi:multidrug efflux pump subunit AcrB
VFNISADQVLAALRANNTIATLGHSKNGRQRVDLMANTLLSTVEGFQQMVVATIAGTQITLADIATVEEGEEEGVILFSFLNKVSEIRVYCCGCPRFLALFWPAINMSAVMR